MPFTLPSPCSLAPPSSCQTELICIVAGSARAERADVRAIHTLFLIVAYTTHEQLTGYPPSSLPSSSRNRSVWTLCGDAHSCVWTLIYVVCTGSHKLHVKLNSLTIHTIRISSQTNYISTDHTSYISSQAGLRVTPAAYQAKHPYGAHQSHIQPNKLYIYGSHQLNTKSNKLYIYWSNKLHIKLSSLTDHTIRISSQTNYISTDHISCMSSQAGRWITPAAYQAKHSCGSHQSHIKPNKLYIYGSQQWISSQTIYIPMDHISCAHIKPTRPTDHTIRISSQPNYISTDPTDCIASPTILRVTKQSIYLRIPPAAYAFDHCLPCSRLSRCFSTPPPLYRIKQALLYLGTSSYLITINGRVIWELVKKSKRLPASEYYLKNARIILAPLKTLSMK